jgi:hypothetical protein
MIRRPASMKSESNAGKISEHQDEDEDEEESQQHQQ